jgi:hypothetical protein
MEVLGVAGRHHRITYIAACPVHKRAVVVGLTEETVPAVLQLLGQQLWRAVAEVHAEPASRNPRLAPVVLSPDPALRAGRIQIPGPAGVLRLAAPNPEVTLDNEDPADKLALRLGNYEVRVLATSAHPVEVAWRVGPAVFTNAALHGPGVWPAAATPRATLAYPDDTLVYPRLSREPTAIGTVGAERRWYARWCERGYRAEIPDESATVRPAGSRIA